MELLKEVKASQTLRSGSGELSPDGGFVDSEGENYDGESDFPVINKWQSIGRVMECYDDELLQKHPAKHYAVTLKPVAHKMQFDALTRDAWVNFKCHSSVRDVLYQVEERDSNGVLHVHAIIQAKWLSMKTGIPGFTKDIRELKTRNDVKHFCIYLHKTYA